MNRESTGSRIQGEDCTLRFDEVKSQAEADRYTALLMSGRADTVKRFRASGDFVLREIAGEGILVPVGAGEEMGNVLFSLNDTSLFLWRAFEKPATIAQVIETIREAYDDPEGSMESHVRAFVLAMLVKRMILED